MKQAQVQIGGVYLTRIGGQLTPVVVTAQAQRRSRFSSTLDGPLRYHVRRLTESAPLPKPRTAAALREVPAVVFHMKDQPWEVLVRREFRPDDPKLRTYTVTIPAYRYAVTGFEAARDVDAAVLCARAMVAAAVFGEGVPS